MQHHDLAGAKMMDSTPRLGLPLLAVGQAQKEVFHNESLATLDCVVAAAVEQPPLNDPPAAPATGSAYIVGDAPTGEWAGNARSLATFTTAGWRIVAPAEGLTAYVRSTASWAAFRAGAWEVGRLRGASVIIDGEQVVGSRAAAIPSPSGGTVIDTAARNAVDAILSAMREHGLIES
jgi:hypothetical protein